MPGKSGGVFATDCGQRQRADREGGGRERDEGDQQRQEGHGGGGKEDRGGRHLRRHPIRARRRHAALRRRGRLDPRPGDRNGPQGPGLHPRRRRSSLHRLLRRVANAHSPRASPPFQTHRPTSRRTEQSPRFLRAGLARQVPRRLRRQSHPGLARRGPVGTERRFRGGNQRGDIAEIPRVFLVEIRGGEGISRQVRQGRIRTQFGRGGQVASVRGSFRRQRHQGEFGAKSREGLGTDEEGGEVGRAGRGGRGQEEETGAEPSGPSEEHGGGIDFVEGGERRARSGRTAIVEKRRPDGDEGYEIDSERTERRR
mmetsp:Transcript_25285/g.51635  ORF Transcript_25285/g.51635 Transcript_25285/m.51635 type:complete len:312 (+) Transcript_25285:547-1482(+)